jgi:hypothetical protein
MGIGRDGGAMELASRSYCVRLSGRRWCGICVGSLPEFSVLTPLFTERLAWHFFVKIIL